MVDDTNNQKKERSLEDIRDSQKKDDVSKTIKELTKTVKDLSKTVKGLNNTLKASNTKTSSKKNNIYSNIGEKKRTDFNLALLNKAERILKVVTQKEFDSLVRSQKTGNKLLGSALDKRLEKIMRDLKIDDKSIKEVAKLKQEAAAKEKEEAKQKADKEKEKAAKEKKEAKEKAAKEKKEAKEKADKEKKEAKEKADKEKKEAKEKAAKEKKEAKEKAAKEKEEAKQKAAKEKEEAKQKAAKEKEEAKQKAAKEKEEAKQKAAKEKEANTPTIFQKELDRRENKYNVSFLREMLDDKENSENIKSRLKSKTTSQEQLEEIKKMREDFLKYGFVRSVKELENQKRIIKLLDMIKNKSSSVGPGLLSGLLGVGGFGLRTGGSLLGLLGLGGLGRGARSLVSKGLQKGGSLLGLLGLGGLGRGAGSLVSKGLQKGGSLLGLLGLGGLGRGARSLVSKGLQKGGSLLGLLGLGGLGRGARSLVSKGLQKGGSLLGLGGLGRGVSAIGSRIMGGAIGRSFKGMTAGKLLKGGLKKIGDFGLKGLGGLVRGAGGLLGRFGVTSLLSKIPGLNMLLGGAAVGAGAYKAFKDAESIPDFLQKFVGNSLGNIVSLISGGIIDSKYISKQVEFVLESLGGITERFFDSFKGEGFWGKTKNLVKASVSKVGAIFARMFGLDEEAEVLENIVKSSFATGNNLTSYISNGLVQNPETIKRDLRNEFIKKYDLGEILADRDRINSMTLGPLAQKYLGNKLRDADSMIAEYMRHPETQEEIKKRMGFHNVVASEVFRNSVWDNLNSTKRDTVGANWGISKNTANVNNISNSNHYSTTNVFNDPPQSNLSASDVYGFRSNVPMF